MTDGSGLTHPLLPADTSSFGFPDAKPRRPSHRRFVRPIAGLATVLVIAAIVAVAAVQFRGGFTDSVSVTALSNRAGLLMNPGAKVKWHGVQVGTVAAIDELPNGQARLHLEVQSSQVELIPHNVLVDVGAPTVFGAKSVRFVAPPDPSPQRLVPGQELDAQHVTVEVNTIFEQLVAVLETIDPAKLNQTLGAMATAFNGRGEKFGQTLANFNAFLEKIEPSLPALGHDIDAAATVLNAYADVAPDLRNIMENATRLSQTIVDEQPSLDAFLVNTIGLAEIGNDVLSQNGQGLRDLVHLLVPTVALTDEYHEALTCGLKNLAPLANQPPNPNPGVEVLGAMSLGIDRYRYPQNLPKVAAKGGPQCAGQLPLAFNTFPPFDVADTGANPWQNGNAGIVLNSDALKQFLFGPIDGPPRNSAQIGQPG